VSDELAILYQVQQGDTETARLQAALAGLDNGDELASQITSAEAELADLQGARRTTDKEQMDCQLELTTLEEKKQKFQGQLYGGSINNPRQLQDLQGEVDMLSREISKLEDRLLELMQVTEDQRSEEASREAGLAESGQTLEEVRAKYAKTKDRLRGELADLAAGRKALAAQINPHLLKRYEQIRARQSNLGLVKVTGSTCPGCQITLASEVLKELKVGSQNQSCDNCGRMLCGETTPEGSEA